MAAHSDDLSDCITIQKLTPREAPRPSSPVTVSTPGPKDRKVRARAKEDTKKGTPGYLTFAGPRRAERAQEKRDELEEEVAERRSIRILQQMERKLEAEREEEREREASVAAYRVRLAKEDARAKVGGARVYREPRGAMFVVAQLVSHL